MKDFDIIYRGKKETITINDNPNVETVFRIGELGIDWTKMPPTPKPKELAVAAACNLIVKAPWGNTDPSTILKMDYADFKNVVEAMTKVYNLNNFLSTPIQLMYGNTSEPSPSTTESITFSPPGESPSSK